MFYRGYGLGGLEGLKGLPDRICYLVMILKHYSLIFITPPLKEGRRSRRRVYGVNNNKFYGGIASKTGLENLHLAGRFEQFEKREDLFDRNRLKVQKWMRFNLF